MNQQITEISVVLNQHATAIGLTAFICVSQKSLQVFYCAKFGLAC